MSTTSKFNMNIVYVILAVLLTVVVISQIKDNDNKSGLDKAADKISDGIHDAADELDDRGPVEKVGDSIKDATN